MEPMMHVCAGNPCGDFRVVGEADEADASVSRANFSREAGRSGGMGTSLAEVPPPPQGPVGPRSQLEAVSSCIRHHHGVGAPSPPQPTASSGGRNRVSVSHFEPPFFYTRTKEGRLHRSSHKRIDPPRSEDAKAAAAPHETPCPTTRSRCHTWQPFWWCRD